MPGHACWAKEGFHFSLDLPCLRDVTQKSLFGMLRHFFSQTTHVHGMQMHVNVGFILFLCRTMFCSVLSLSNQCMLLLQQRMAHSLLEAGHLAPSMFGPQAAANCYEAGLHTTR